MIAERVFVSEDLRRETDAFQDRAVHSRSADHLARNSVAATSNANFHRSLHFIAQPSSPAVAWNIGVRYLQYAASLELPRNAGFVWK